MPGRFSLYANFGVRSVHNEMTDSKNLQLLLERELERTTLDSLVFAHERQGESPKRTHRPLCVLLCRSHNTTSQSSSAARHPERGSMYSSTPSLSKFAVWPIFRSSLIRTSSA